MRLSATQLTKVEEQLGIEALPEDHPASSDLKDAFGDHTFFLDAAGLNIVEPNPSPEGKSGHVLKVASWTSDEQRELVVHQAEVQSVTVDLGTDDPGSAA